MSTAARAPFTKVAARLPLAHCRGRKIADIRGLPRRRQAPPAHPVSICAMATK